MQIKFCSLNCYWFPLLSSHNPRGDKSYTNRDVQRNTEGSAQSIWSEGAGSLGVSHPLPLLSALLWLPIRRSSPCVSGFLITPLSNCHLYFSWPLLFILLPAHEFSTVQLNNIIYLLYHTCLTLQWDIKCRRKQREQKQVQRVVPPIKYILHGLVPKKSLKGCPLKRL